MRDSDAHIITGIRKGDERALSALITEYHPALCDYAYRVLGSADLAESAVMDVIASIWDRRASFELKTSLRAYLVGAVRLRAYNIARARGVESDWEDRAAREQSLPGMGAPPLAP